MALTALASRTLHDQVYHALYHAILEGDLEPGSRIIEAEISAALGISRGPVREAIRRLEAEGLLVTRAYRGTHIVRLSGHDVVELYSVRVALEGFAAVSGLDVLRAEHLEVMEEQLDGLDRAARAPDWDRVAVLDADWHSQYHNGRQQCASARHVDNIQWPVTRPLCPCCRLYLSPRTGPGTPCRPAHCPPHGRSLDDRAGHSRALSHLGASSCRAC